MNLINAIAVFILVILIGAGVGVFGGLVLFLIERRRWK